MKDHPLLKVCSAHTVEFVCKELKQSTQVVNGDKREKDSLVLNIAMATFIMP